jgi:rhodanese-related sulfurtransferase
MPGFGTLSPAQLARLVGTPDAPVVFDVRVSDDIAADPRRIPASHACAHTTPPEELAGLAGARPAVVVCQSGRKLSEGVAALLRSAGVAAESLEGGWEAWVSAGLPTTPIASLPRTRRWVTRHRPKIDRIACPWLIRRFVDPDAEFLFVAPAEVMAVAERFDAVPFDVEDAAFSHRGENCTFDAILDDLSLHTEALDRLALVVRAADTDRHDLVPQAAGLLAISVGLSRQYKDDLAQLVAGMTVYDALYRWARDGYDEGHDWPAGRQS